MSSIRAAAAMLLLLLTTALVEGPAAAQSINLSLAGQSVYVTAEGTLMVWLDWTGPSTDPELEVTVAVHQRVVDEDDLKAQPGEVLNRSVPVPIPSLPSDAAGHLILEVGIRSFSGGDQLLIPDAGVYPVTIEVRGPEGVIRSLRTNLIRLPTETAEIGLLPVGVLLPISSADGLDAAQAADLLEKHPTLPISVLLGPGVLTQLRDDPPVAERLQQALNGRKVVATLELNLDPSALVAVGQGQLYTQAVAETEADLTELGFESLPGVLPVDVPLTTAGAALLLDLGVSQVIDVGTVPRPGGFLDVDDRRLQVVQLENDLTAEFQGPGRAAERGHRLVARLAVRSETDRSPIVLGGADLAAADTVSLDIMLAALDQAGLLEAVDVRDAAVSGLRIRPSESPTQDLTPLQSDLVRTLALIGTYETFHVSGGTNPANLRSELLSAMSRDLNPENRVQAVEQLVSNIDESLDVLRLPATETVTLAAQRSVLTLTIENDAPGPRAVLLRFQSDKLDVDQNNLVMEIPPGPSTIDIDIRTRSVGESPLEMLVLTPDEQHELARSKIQVRSTAVPGLGLLLSGTALVFLLIWWGRSIVSTRRARAADLAEPEDAGEDDQPEQDRSPVGAKT